MPTPDAFHFISDLVRNRAAIVIEAGKEYLVDARLRPVAQKAGFDSIEQLVAKLKAGAPPELVQQVVEAMTTNETSFFRDNHPFETLRTNVLPELIKSRSNSRMLRIWCAAASTGQEPYSLALTIAHHFPELASWNVQIIATDINASVLARARAGRYSQLDVNRGLPAAMLVKYFERIGAEWELKPEIRKMVSFQELNLLERWPFFTQQDLVFIRNVLIYFDVDTKRTIFNRMRQALRDDGFLVLGGAETTTNIDDRFVSVRRGTSVFFQLRPEEKRVANGTR